MASFFKTSCVIFWFTWLGCLAYYFATAIYASKYIHQTKESARIYDLLKIVCFFNIIMSIVGCIFVKCSITHVLCAALYIPPIIGLNLVFCSLGIMAVRSLVSVTAEQLAENVKEVFNATSRYPEWIYNIQEQLPCCGVHSYLDFPLIFNESTVLNFVVPKSCCQVSARRSERNCNSDLDISIPQGVNIDSNITNSELQTPAQTLQSLGESCTLNSSGGAPYRDRNITFTSIGNLTDKVFTCGCYFDYKLMEDGLNQSHFIFFVIILFASFGMAFAYIKVWCKPRRANVDSGSDHSLDELDEGSSVRGGNVGDQNLQDFVPETDNVLNSNIPTKANAPARRSIQANLRKHSMHPHNVPPRASKL